MLDRITALSAALVVVTACAEVQSTNAASMPKWSQSPANAWNAPGSIPEKSRSQIRITPGDSVDAHPPGTFLAVTTPAGMARLKRSQYKADYWGLSVNFATQQTQTLCSVATAVTILNSLPIKRPLDLVYKPYPYFTQANYFNDGVASIRSYQHTLTDGMTLEMAAKAMKTHGASTKAVHAEDVSVDDFRRMARENLKRDGDFVAVNYQRKLIGQPKGAHFSPLGAYDERTDTFLVLDVARYKFPPVWVRAADLYAAMNTKDSETPLSRGFILIGTP
jgi:hypothetical protein